MAFILLLASSTAVAGLSSSLYSSAYGEEGVVVTAVDIKDQGLYNLVISIQFLRRPRDSKIYKSDEYEKLIDRLTVESRGIILQKVLETRELKLTDFPDLKNSIQSAVEKRIAELKSALLPEKEAEVVFSLANFFLLEPGEK
jgi:bifunctional pyridoxal-dependent enzyme with beta-cystathionase and maltose regulon repressor activities